MVGKEDEITSLGTPVSNPEDVGLNSFLRDRDALLRQTPPDSVLPQDEDEFTARDAFSADYIDFMYAKRDLNDKMQGTDGQLRQDLLEKPHLMAEPEEGALRGAGAVWRSLRDQLHEESMQFIDRSGPEELQLLRNELELRQALVQSLAAGNGLLIKRLDDRLASIAEASGKSGIGQA